MPNYQPADDDLMLSSDLYAGLKPNPDASMALVDLFAVHGRASFSPDVNSLSHLAAWTDHNAPQRFERAIAALIEKEYIRRMRDGRCKIVSRDLMTGAEYRAAYPENHVKGNGIG